MIDNTNKIAVIEHGAFYDAHVVALIVGQTKSFVKVRIWHSRTREFSEEVKSRKISSVVAILGEAGADPVAIHRVHERIQSAQSHMIEVQRNSRIDYHKKIKEIKLDS